MPSLPSLELTTRTALRAQLRPRTTLETFVYEHVDSVPAEVWQPLRGRRDPFLSPAYLRAMAAAPGVTQRYAVLRCGRRVLGFAVLQSFRIGLSAMPALRPSPGRDETVRERISRRVTQAVLGCLDLRVLIVGNGYMSDPVGVWSDPALDAATFAAWLDQLTRDPASAPFRPTLLLIKDPPASPLDEALVSAGYLPIDTDPSMSLTLRPEWGAPGGYAAALTSRYRKKLQRTRARGEALTRRPLSVREIGRRSDRIDDLYAQVLERSGLCPVRKDARTFAHLAEALPRRFSVVGYFLRDRLVAFNTRFHTPETLHSHFFGMDYAVSRELELYRNLLLDDLEDGIDDGVRRVAYGRGAHESKSALGATPHGRWSYGRHRSGLLTRILSPVGRHMAVAPWPSRHPFATRSLETSNA